MRRLDKAYAAFFRRLQGGEKPGYPRFKVAGRYDSMEFPAYGDGLRLQEKLRIQHVGQVKVKQHRGMEGAIKTVTLKREADKWYAIFSCDLGDVSIASSANPPVGIDVGIESFLTTSEVEHEPNPAYLKAQKTEGREEPQESGWCSACLARSGEEFAGRTSSPSSFEVVPSLRSDCCGKPQHQGDVTEPQTQSCDCRCRMGRLSGNPAMQG
jgi:hypothetical protein